MRLRGHCGLWQVYNISKFENLSAVRNRRSYMGYTNAEIDSMEYVSFSYVVNVESLSMNLRIPAKKGPS
jgi:hypothetical protein